MRQDTQSGTYITITHNITIKIYNITIITNKIRYQTYTYLIKVNYRLLSRAWGLGV
jgi:hypothetical protein